MTMIAPTTPTISTMSMMSARERLSHRSNQLVAIALQTLGVFVLPLAVATGLVIVTSASEVQETASRAVVVVAAVVAPLVLLQLTGVVVRARRLWAQRRATAQRALGVGDVVDVAHAACGVVTRRGGWVIGSGLCGLVAAIVAGQAEFVVFAVVVLAACIVVVTVATTTATFGVRGVDAACVQRAVEPAVASVGEPFVDTFVVDAVVPRGFGLRIAAPLSARLGGETRLFLEGDPRRRRTRASAPLPRAPRGVHVLPAATVVLEDSLGLTAVAVGGTGAARCKVLPRLRPVGGLSALSSCSPRADDVVLPRPRAREDLFDLRPFVRGDDARRIHWRQSVRAGEWIVRTPECDPTQSRRVDVVLDTFVAAGLAVTDDDHAAVAAVFDVAVDAWLGTADALRRQGHDVTLVAAVPDDHGVVAVRALPCRQTRDSAWRDLGARAAAQATVPLADVVVAPAHTIVVSCALGDARDARDASNGGAQALLARVVVDALPLVPEHLADVPRWSLRSLFLLPHAAGSDDNLPDAVARRKRRDKARVVARAALRARLQARRAIPGDNDVRVEQRGTTLLLAAAATTSTTTRTGSTATTKKKTTTIANENNTTTTTRSSRVA